MEKYFNTKDNKAYRAVLAFFLCICIMIVALNMWYYDRLQKTIDEESNLYLQEIATRIGGNINTIIQDTYNMLYSTGHVLQSSDVRSFSGFRVAALEQEHFWDFESIYLIDEEGNSYDVQGNKSVLAGDAYLRDVILNKKKAMSPLQVINGKECAVFAVPLAGIAVEGTDMAALAVAYSTSAFGDVLAMESFDDQAYSHVADADGSIIIRSSAPAAKDMGYNVISTIAGSPLVSRGVANKIRRDLSAGAAGKAKVEFGGAKQYMVYVPIESTSWYLMTFVPVAVVNAKSNILLNITIIISAFIVVSFALVLLILIAAFRRYQKRLEHIAYVDEVTGGHSIERFYELATEALSVPRHPQYALVYTNFSKFKVLNEKFGRPVCDNMLFCFYSNVSKTLSDKECIGRLAADNFCLLLEAGTQAEIIRRFESWYEMGKEEIARNKPVWSLPLMEFGIYIIENETMPFTQMIDRAKLALRENARSVNAKVRYAIYNDEVRRRLFREKQLEDMMEEAYAQREFQVYLQPKFRAGDERIVGAEALVRWVSRSEGMIFPDEFIPLFEKNGFIGKLDLLVFEEVCRILRGWIDEGREPIKISVNCSRVHLKDSEFLYSYRKIADAYGLMPNLLEIEITEGMVLEDEERFKRVVEEIHDVGFGCSIDDFGSGYSSLNIIQDITADTLKLDKIFFREAKRDPVRTESVVSSIVSMAGALSMETVAEGVEHYDQVEMLRRIGCDQIQGYVFAKPMPLNDFMKLWEQKG